MEYHAASLALPVPLFWCTRPPPRLSLPQVYLLLENLLATGLSTLPPAFMHSSATDERLLVLPASAADAARRFRRMVRGGGRVGTAFAPAKPSEDKEAGKGAAADPTPPPVPETPSSRGGQQFSSAYADPLGAVAFDIPPDALPAPPARAAVARRAPNAAPLGAPLRPTPPPPAFKGAVEESAAKARQPEGEGFGAFGEVEMLGGLRGREQSGYGAHTGGKTLQKALPCASLCNGSSLLL